MGFMRRFLPIAAVLAIVAASSVNAATITEEFDDFVRLSVLKQNSAMSLCM